MADDLFRVRILTTGEEILCQKGESLLAAMGRLGRRGIPAGCLGGGCGVCKIHVQSGRGVALGPVSRAHVSEEEENSGYTLACRFSAMSDLAVSVVGKFRKPFLRGFGNGFSSTRDKQGDIRWE
ncbi:MAG: 2Fe-2S iron-sulfur cluster binding domain-containing protein [Acetobacteraceae bacterium]|nr:2Fe-2S iron-sulfur cluster binding domain-containing protein [Acetobacteraceae bacterium]